MQLKVKNTLGKNKNITLVNGDLYELKKDEEKIVGEYSEEIHGYIFNLLKAGFKVCKVINNTSLDDSKLKSEKKTNKNNKDNNIEVKDKPKRKRGRPPKNPK